MTIDMVDKSGEANVIKADMSLQAKIGTGPLDEKVVERCQDAMESTSKNVDFAPLAQEYLDQLKNAALKSKAGELTKDEAVEAMTTSVMQLKANAATFNYMLIGNLANVMLSFLEAIKELDKTVIEIVMAHHTTLNAIVLKKMTGDGGEAGKLMESELKAACKRYFMKKK